MTDLKSLRIRCPFSARSFTGLAACILAVSFLAFYPSALLAMDAGPGTGDQSCSQSYQQEDQSLPDQMRVSDCQQGQAETNADNLTPEQRAAIQREISRNGGLTPEAVDAIRHDPEFQGVDVDEVLRGRELQQMKGSGQGGGEPTYYNYGENVSNGTPYDRYGERRYGERNGGYGGNGGGTVGGAPYGKGASKEIYRGGDGYGNGNGPDRSYNGNYYGSGTFSRDYSAAARQNAGPYGGTTGQGGPETYGPFMERRGYGVPAVPYERGYEGGGPEAYGPFMERQGYGVPAAPYGRGYEGKGPEAGAPERAGEMTGGERRGLPAERGSLFDRYIKNSPLEVSRLKPFGYDLFNGILLGQPRDLPVASDYAVGPGDEINIFLWGRVNAHYRLVVNRDGTILFPGVGALTVSGMTFKDMKRFLTNEARKIVGAEVNITMGRLRSFQVFVLGEVEKPGAYTLSAMSTLTNALMAAGGPTSIGSLRKVELKRDDATVATMDFYNLLLNGDRSKDLRLQNGDLVFVPTIGPIVGVAGNVKRPAVYELAGETDLSAVLRLAGGIIPTAYTQQIQVERAENNEKRIVLDINAKEPGAASSFKLHDGDLVKVASIIDGDTNAVYLHGNVKRPGKYELKKGMRLGDIIKDESALKKESYLKYGLIKRLVPPAYTVKLIPFSLKAVFADASSAENITLKPLDVIYVFSRWFFRDRPTVTINGYVRKGGRFRLEDNMTVKDLVLLAGSLRSDASRGEFELYRTDPDTAKVTLIKLDLGKAMAGDSANDIKLRDRDRVVIHSIRDTSPWRSITVTGQVNRPGTYEYAENMTVRDLVFAAGGLRESAYVDDAELSSSVIKPGQSFAIKYEKINLGKAMAGDPADNLRLNPYDTLFVKKIPDWRAENYVVISGEVVFPGRYVVRKGDTLSSLVDRAGGVTSKSYVKGAVFTRESVRALQQKNIDEAVNRLEKTTLSAAASNIQSSLTPEDAKQQAAALEQKKELIAKMKAAKAKGRISINLAEAMKQRGSSFDVRLENGDKLVIPERPSDVQVMGSVYNQTAFVYDPNASISSYIKKAGGFTGDADEDEIFILKEDGTAVGRRDYGSWAPRWDSAEHRWVSGGFMSSDLDPGDTIVVPERLEKIAWLREIKDFTQILYQIAVTAGVAIRVL